MRPFCIATIGAILGIITGLYLQSIALFVLVFIISTFLIILINSLKQSLLTKIIFIFLICFLSFWTYTCFLEKKYNAINQSYNEQEVEIQAIVISDKTEKEYKDVYQIQVIKPQKFKMLLNLKKDKNYKLELQYGDKISFTATYEIPSIARNEGGFNYQQYLKTKNIVGIANIKPNQVKVIEKNKISIINKVIHDIRINTIEKIKEILPADTANLCTGILLGEMSELSEDIQEDFRKSNLLHVLAISGANISYILLGIGTVVQKLKFHKRWSKIALIVFLMFFMTLVGFGASVTRACIMAILQLLAGILFKKSDIYQNLAISSFILLLANPYTLFDIGFQLSFGGTIGIVLFSKRLTQKSNKIDGETNKLEILNEKKQIGKIREICIVTLSANLLIIPIMMYHFNTISFTFLISNLLVSPILEISLIWGMIFLITIFIFQPIAILISFFIHPILQLMIWIANFSGKLPFSQILVPTPTLWQIFLYYLILYLIFLKKSNALKSKLFQSKKIILFTIILLMVLPYTLKIFPDSKLTIHFIDVGQGDSMLIQTPFKKNVLIDGGGSETGSFDVGEKTLLPYLLDKGITKIDYMLFSHFDSDHCERIVYCYGKFGCKNCNCK